MTGHRVARRGVVVLLAIAAIGLGGLPPALALPSSAGTPVAAAPLAAAPAAVVPAAKTRAAAANSVIDTSVWPIHNRSDKDCVVVHGTAYDAPAVAARCDLAYTDQYWGLQWSGVGDYYQLKNRNSGRCLLARGTANNTVAVQAACAANTDQHWLIQQDAAGETFMLKNRNSGKCLTMRPTEANAVQATCGTQYINQWWQRGMPYVDEWTPYLRKPVYIVHGYSDDGSGFDVNGAYFNNVISSLKDCSAASNRGVLCHQGPIARTWSFCYYSVDTGCDLLSPGDRERPIKDVGADLAWEIYDHFSKFNVPVDAIGHSMGGLVLKAAMTGVTNGDLDFPPFLLVEDVVTVSTPHEGIPLALGCQFQQCIDMRGDSEFRQWVEQTPRTAIGTSWSLIGSDDDLTVPADRAVPDSITNVPHKSVYRGDQILPKIYAHMDILDHVSETKTYSVDICDYDHDCSMNDRTTFERITTVSPGRMVKELLSGPDDE